MVDSWDEMPLGILTENFDSMRIPVKEKDRVPGPYPYYGASGIVDHVSEYLFDGEYLLVAEDGENLRSRNTPVAFMANGRFWVNNHAHIVRGNDKADTRFLMYALAATDISGYLTGSTMPKLTQGNLNRIPVVAPPLHIQQAIASILGALDDKIELNRRRNRTLEALARAIFQSWFVDFDPVRAKLDGRRPTGMDEATAKLFPDTFTDSPLGPIPTGWRVGIVAELAEVGSGKRPTSKSAAVTETNVVPVWGGNGIIGFSHESFTDRPILLTGRVGTLGSIFRIYEPCWPSDNTLIVRVKDNFTFEFLYAQLQDMDLLALNRGSTQPLLTQSDLKSQCFVLPDGALLEVFHAIAESLYSQVDATAKECGTLTALRDSLLPKLISGELRVAEAERIVEDVA